MQSPEHQYIEQADASKVPLRQLRPTSIEFPIITFDWMPRALGFFGRSITEEVYSVQMSIDELLNVASQSYSMVGMPIIFVPDNAQIPEDVILSNFIARLIPYRGDQKPSIETPEPLPQSFFNFLQQHIQWVFQIVGLSQTTATSQNQLGPDASGAAIRELVDIETTRFAQVSTRWEDNFVKIAHTIVNLSKQLYEKGMTDLSVDFHYKKMIDTIKWKDVNIDCSFDCKCDPVSQLPDSTAGRIQTIQEYIDRQWISKERGMEMLNLDPDLQQEVNIQTSSLRLCEKRLSEMVEEGKVFKPEPYMNLQQALDISKGVYNMLVIDGCPEDRLQGDLDKWMNHYNTERTHSGKYCFGKTPMHTFIDSIPLAKQKLLETLAQDAFPGSPLKVGEKETQSVQENEKLVYSMIQSDNQ